MVVFGDSLSDTGNTTADITAALRGEAGGLAAGLPQTELPYAPFYDNGRLTNGPTTSPSSSIKGVWVEQLAPKLGIAVPTNSLAGGTNFAFAGAETGAGTGFGGLVQNMGMQLTDFCGTCTSVSSSNLYVLWGGADDILDAMLAAQDPTAAATAAANNIAGYIGKLANAGAKNFLWPNLPPLTSIPEAQPLSGPAKTLLATATIFFNSQWMADIAALEAAHPGIDIMSLDTNALFQSIASNSASYGLTNITTPAANFLNGGLNVNPDTYLFWDLEHPTTKGHELLADAAAALPEPSTIALAGIGFAVLAIARRRRAKR